MSFTRPAACVYPEECAHYGKCLRPGDHDCPPPCAAAELQQFFVYGLKPDGSTFATIVPAREVGGVISSRRHKGWDVHWRRHSPAASCSPTKSSSGD